MGVLIVFKFFNKLIQNLFKNVFLKVFLLLTWRIKILENSVVSQRGKQEGNYTEVDFIINYKAVY